MYPRRPGSFALVLTVLVVLGVLGFGEYLATAGDVLIWVLMALVVFALARGGVNLMRRKAASR